MSHTHGFAEISDLDGRYDLYGGVHKGLRKAQCDLLGRLGSADYENVETTRPLLAELRGLITLAAAHVEHEDTHIHGALRQLAISTATLDDQHDDHWAAFRDLENRMTEIEAAAPGRRAAAGRRLYLAFAAYVSEDLAHMHEEETVTAPLLWAHFSDAEIQAIEMKIIGSMPPEKNMAFMRIMIPAMNPAERAALLGGMKQAAPKEAFDAVIEFAARPNLTAAEFADLAARLAIAA